jgi:hypothetical protein
MDGQPEPTKPAGELYLEAVLESLEEAVQEYRDGSTEELPINTQCLCVDPLTESIEVEEWYDDEGEELEEPLMITLDDEKKIIGHKFVVTTGGPHAEFQTKDNGETWTFFYCDWFGSEAYTYHFGKNRLLEEAFGIWFECGGAIGQEIGAWV